MLDTKPLPLRPLRGWLRAVTPVAGMDLNRAEATPDRSAEATPDLTLRRPWPRAIPGGCTPDRSKLFGSHGQRPWFHETMR